MLSATASVKKCVARLVPAANRKFCAVVMLRTAPSTHSVLGDVRDRRPEHGVSKCSCSGILTAMKRFSSAIGLLAVLVLSACTPVQTTINTPQPPQTGGSLEVESDGEAPAKAQTLEPESLTGSLLPERLLSSGLLELGNRDAPHTMLLVTEHHCSYCRNFFVEHMPNLERQYIQPGTLRLTITILPLKKYAGSTEMSAGLSCSGKQNKGLPMHRLLFERSGSDRASLLSYAHELKLDEKLFGECLKSTEIAAQLEEQSSWLRSLNVSVVPTYFIDGKKYSGLPYAADLEGQIREALER